MIGFAVELHQTKTKLQGQAEPIQEQGNEWNFAEDCYHDRDVIIFDPAIASASGVEVGVRGKPASDIRRGNGRGSAA